MTWFLEVTSGVDSGKKVLLDKSPILIGRDQARCTMVLSDSTISGNHARLSYSDNNVFYLEDMNSTNGTFVNEQRISGIVQISPKDTIRLGDSQIKLEQKNASVVQHDLQRDKLQTEAISIGRSPTNNLIIDQPSVSRQHALIEQTNRGWTLTDLQSTGGTTLDGKRISGTVELTPGSWIGISEINYYFDDDKLLDEEGRVVLVIKAKQDKASVQSQPLAHILALPFTGLGSLKWLLGSILLALPVISFFADGYRYRLFKNGSTGNLLLPEWDDWGDLFIKGLQFFLVRLVYSLGSILLFLLLPYLVIIGINNPPSGLFLMSMIPGLLLLTAVGFFMPMCWAHFAATGSIAEAFNINLIINKIASVFEPYLMAILVMIGLWVIVALMATIPYAGIFLAILGFFFVYIIMGLHFGNLYWRSS